MQSNFWLGVDFIAYPQCVPDAVLRCSRLISPLDRYPRRSFVTRRVDSAKSWLGFRIVSEPMDAKEIETVVLHALTHANQARESVNHLVVSPDAVIFGPGSPLDSLGLVALLMDIEDGLRDRGLEVNLSDPRAVSATRSPFRDVPSLVRFISEVAEQAA